MTRNFRDEWEAASSSRPDGEPTADVAPEHVQDRVSAMLRAAAKADARDAAMPVDVEARIRAALVGEFEGAASSSGDKTEPTPALAPTTGTVVPLPGRRPVSEDAEVTHPAGTVEESGWAAGDARSSSNRPTGTSASPAGVSSLDAHRNRTKGRLGKAAIALGAAAAVAVGAVTVSKSLDGEDSPVADAPASSQTQQDYASRVRVTQTETRYSSNTLATQAASLPSSKSTPIEAKQADAQSLGPLATGAGVQACLDAVASSLDRAPDKVYADFGTYNGKPAVIVVTVKDGNQTAWVVSRFCNKSSDLKAGPTPITT